MTLYTKDIRFAPDDEPVCWCAGITKKAILHAVENGARSLQAIQRMTGACTSGHCKEKNPRGR